ncbi:MAG TPA: MerR family transcriptional regulator [Jatrophihabitans sp.]|nr:MerR family transcriptional regulator [Jatrophihabitans sp.]
MKVLRIHSDRTEEEGIGCAELMARSGLSYRQVDFYCRTGYLRTIGEGHPGNGYARRFSVAEANIAVFIKQLLDTGFTAAAAAALAREHVETGRALIFGAGGFLLIGVRTTA